MYIVVGMLDVRAAAGELDRCVYVLPLDICVVGVLDECVDIGALDMCCCRCVVVGVPDVCVTVGVLECCLAVGEVYVYDAVCMLDIYCCMWVRRLCWMCVML